MNTQGNWLIGLLLFVGFLIPGSVFGATITWNGGSGDWNTAGNWDTASVPTSGDTVIINSGSVTASGSDIDLVN